jgi:leader peptidase (prepilin peptidase)/N-methyltransferase
MDLWIAGGVAAGVGLLGGWWLEGGIARERQTMGLPPVSAGWRRLRPWLTCLAVVAVVVGMTAAELRWNSLETPEVQPSTWGRQARLVYHAILGALLVLATVIDLDCYLLPDSLTLPGLLVGFVGAVGLQEVQIAHLWVDWAYAIPQLRGPYIPTWYSTYPWAHALAWSLAGALTGAGITQLVRGLSRWILGQEAMGFGDVTLMLMIGSFTGWQAVVLIFILAPLTGLVFAIVGKIVANQPYLPYGPCLAAATLIVLVSWSWLWAQTRLIFSDLLGVGLLAAAALAALVVLLLLIRGYRSIPTRGTAT